LGDGTLRARYIRGTFEDKPFVLGKYELTRIRATISELAANGGAPFGFYARFTDPLARAEIARYYQFMKRHDNLIHANRSHAEAVLIFPRSHVHNGDLAPMIRFKDWGKRLLDAHVLFDVLPDDLVTQEKLAKYAHVIRTDMTDLPDLATQKDVSHITAPYTVRVAASRPEKGENLTIHFVNYNREEPPYGRDGKPSAGSGIKDEKPIAVSGVEADLLLPENFQAADVKFYTPEKTEAIRVEWKQTDRRLKLLVPEFLVYGIVDIVPRAK
jgi:hypothetical protein